MSTATIQLSDEVIDVLRRSTVTDGALCLPPQQLARPLYVAVNKAIECLGGKWNKSAKAHLFAGAGLAQLNAVLDAGEVVDEVKLYQFYPTPRAVVDRLLGWAEIANNHLVLEPSAGSGAIVGSIPRKSRIHVCEIQELKFRRAHAAIFEGTHFVCADFLDYNPGAIYDRIIANPPFTKSQDVMHVRHMLDLVKPGGRVVSVMASSAVSGINSKLADLRGKLDRDFVHRFEELPADSFSESGTGVNTVVLIATRLAIARATAPDARGAAGERGQT